MPENRALQRGAWIGVACALAGSVAFSGKPVLVKAAYVHGIDTTTLLTLRMLFAAPLFMLMALWAGRMTEPVSRREIAALAGLGFLGYYL
ncbi:MAG: EamA/RhaT family transporter, partial [Betaproteobacteria bacterium]|nr:EamA/RhaT family transporter [Betaproteobacteria bacterium]